MNYEYFRFVSGFPPIPTGSPQKSPVKTPTSPVAPPLSRNLSNQSDSSTSTTASEKQRKVTPPKPQIQRQSKNY